MDEQTNGFVEEPTVASEAEQANLEAQQAQAQPVEQPKKKKKKHVGLIIFLIIFVVIFVLPPAFVFIFIYDTSMMKVTYDQTFNAEKWGEALVMDSLDNTVTDQAASFSITESDINNIIYQSIKDEEELNKYVKQIAIDIGKKNYNFNISAKLGFFQTRLKLSMRIEKLKMPKGSTEEDAYVFTMSGASIGRLPNLKNLVTTILKNSVGDSTFGDDNFKIYSDVAHSRFYVFTSDFRKLINTALSGDGGSSQFYTSFVNDFLDSGLVEVNFYDNDALTIKVKLNELTGNDYGEGQYVYYGMPYENTTTKLTINGEQRKLSLDSIRDALVSLLNNGLITQAEMNTVSEYLFNGYHDSNAPSCSLESIGITNKEAYLGFNVAANISIDNLITNSVKDFSGYNMFQNSFDIADLKESDVNAFLHTQRLFGNKFFLSRTKDDNSYKASYIAVDNAYINLTSNGAILTAGLNINGLETIVTILMNNDLEHTGGAKMAFKTSEIYFGGTDEHGEHISASDGTKSLLFTTLRDAASSDSFSFSEDGSLQIDFTALIQQGMNQIVTDPEYKDFLNEHAAYSVRVVGENVSDDNVIRLTANRI